MFTIAFALAVVAGVAFVVWGETGWIPKVLVAVYTAAVGLMTFGVVPAHFLVPLLMEVVLVIGVFFHFKIEGLV